jgi:hypothetical protein
LELQIYARRKNIPDEYIGGMNGATVESLLAEGSTNGKSIASPDIFLIVGYKQLSLGSC